MERLRGEPEMVDTTNERGSEGTAERERERVSYIMCGTKLLQ